MSMAGPSSSLARVAGRAARSSYARLTQLRGLATEAPASPAPASSSSSQWSPPISPGTCAAYDEALAFISSNQADIKRRITELQQTSPQAADSADAAERKRLLDSLTVASEINDPKVRWSFTNTAEDQLDLTDPTTRHLREWAWRKCGSLDKLIERIRDQGVIPDSVSHIIPTVDVQLLLGDVAGPGVTDHSDRLTPPSGDVLPGVIVEQKFLLEPPTLRLTSFQQEPKHHTLVLVDLDVPTKTTIGSTILWAVSNISLSASQPRLLSSSDLLGGSEIASYLPPHPPQGSGRHRYVTLLFEQESSISLEGTLSRTTDIRSLVSQQKLNPVGVHFYRSEWTEASKETISSVWADRLGLEEERWAAVPRKERKHRATADVANWFGSGATAPRKLYQAKGLGSSKPARRDAPLWT